MLTLFIAAEMHTERPTVHLHCGLKIPPHLKCVLCVALKFYCQLKTRQLL